MDAAGSGVAQLQRQIRRNADELNQFVQDVHHWQKQCEGERRPKSESRSDPLPQCDPPRVDTEQIRDRGNIQYRSCQFNAAVKTYSQCLEHDPNDIKSLSNRAAAYLKLGRNADAERDCTEVLAQDPNNVKVLLRRGTARAALHKSKSAMLDFQAIIRISGAGSTAANMAQKHIDTLTASEKKSRAMPWAQVPQNVKDLPRRRIEIQEISDDDENVEDDNRKKIEN